MKKWESILLKGFLYGLPILVVYAVFSYSIDWKNVPQSDNFLRTLYDLGGLILGVWMILAVSLSLRLIFSGTFREATLAKLTLIKERDERESFLTGKAAKSTMLASIAILIFLFCLSCFQVYYYTLPPEQVVEGKTKAISLGMRLDLFADEAGKAADAAAGGKSLWLYSGLPFSSSSIILGLIIWQIGFYHFSIKRMMK
jgi:hypothetical protein